MHAKQTTLCALPANKKIVRKGDIKLIQNSVNRLIYNII
ncbi:phenylacrylic acid decarboxylase [Salmonella enterica subsp. enterica serovar Bovismorbificans str. 3114]|nr:phenylacrylic acid decarboxylase [Salmonella enterica subsp. enterica serovar Bovismorbificans str. 3114]